MLYFLGLCAVADQYVSPSLLIDAAHSKSEREVSNVANRADRPALLAWKLALGLRWLSTEIPRPFHGSALMGSVAIQAMDRDDHTRAKSVRACVPTLRGRALLETV